MLRKTLNNDSEVTLPSNESFADQCASLCFRNKNTKIRDTLVLSGTENDFHPSNPPIITDFTQVSEDADDKIIRN